MSEKLKPLGDNVVLEIIEQEKTESGLFIPSKAQSNQRDAQYGKVVAVGAGRVTEYGARIVPQVTEGDFVLIARGAGVEVTSVDSKKKLRIIRDCEILSTVEESRIFTLGTGGLVTK